MKKRFRKFWRRHGRAVLLSCLGLAILIGLMLYRLGVLLPGLSPDEYRVATTPIGWHGLYHQPLDLPLRFLRSIVYFVFPKHGAFLSRLSNAALGGLTVAVFAALLRIWHGGRTAFLGTVLFATSAWTLHVSRVASNDVLYLLTIPLLLLACAMLQKWPAKTDVVYAVALCYSFILTIPGTIWLVLWAVLWQRSAIAEAWQQLGSVWRRLTGLLLGLLWTPVVALGIWQHSGTKIWLGLPSHFATITSMLKQLGTVFVHLFGRGPNNPVLWLGQAPILDVFTLIACLLGIYFYARHWRSGRSHLLAGLFIIGAILISLNGPVSLSTLVPVLYLFAATGIAYLLHEWLAVFPFNPLARGVGMSLIFIAVAAASLYNLRAYFVAWPHDPTTRASFNRHL